MHWQGLPLVCANSSLMSSSEALRQLNSSAKLTLSDSSWHQQAQVKVVIAIGFVWKPIIVNASTN